VVYNISMFYTIALAFLGGFLPSMVWLFFWLEEDRLRPEPKIRIALTFITGAIMVIFAGILEHSFSTNMGIQDAHTVFSWATIEELLKFIAAAIFGLASAAYDEPIDALIYMITAALGFAAAENALFLYGSIAQDTSIQSILVGDTRFIGSTLLHTVSSACIGISLALTFFSPRSRCILAVTIGVILSISLHILFNIFILQQGSAYLLALVGIWISVIVVLLFAEKIKLLKHK